MSANMEHDLLLRLKPVRGQRHINMINMLGYETMVGGTSAVIWFCTDYLFGIFQKLI